MKSFFAILLILSASAAQAESLDGQYTVLSARCLGKIAGRDVWQDCTSQRGSSIEASNQAAKEWQIVETKDRQILFSLDMRETLKVNESPQVRIVERSYFRPIPNGFSWEKFVRFNGMTRESAAVRFYLDNNQYVFTLVTSTGEVRTLLLQKQ